jgi:hexosaminidase
MKYRGALLDVGRHFFSVEEVKTFIDMMAMHKLNCFHWHLTEDQGWRIEIKKYPLLTEIGSVRENSQVIGTHHVHNVGYSGTPYGPYFYTQDQIRDVVKYAEENFVTVVPEIDLPGHSRAALAAYPHLGCKGKDYTVGVKWGVQDEVMCVGKESTFEFIEGVMEEVLELFPSEYIHIGGDECRRKHWEECPACQAKMRAEGFSREAQLQTYCNYRVETYLKKHGRKMIGWDEVLDGGVSESTVVMSWTGVDGGIQAAKAGNDVIMTPHQYCYLNVPNSPDRDHEPPHGTRHPERRGCITLDKAYGYNPYEGLDQEQRKHIIGIQASLWTEHIRLFDHAMYMMNPRMGAISEIGWYNSGKDFQRYLKSQKRLLDLYDHYGFNYSESYWRDN